MNTGDILLLNCVSNLKRRYSDLEVEGVSLDELITESIFLVRKVINEEQETNMSTLTKSSGVFEKVQNRIHMLSEQCTIDWKDR